MEDIIDVNPSTTYDNVTVEEPVDELLEESTSDIGLLIKSIICNKVFIGFIVFLVIALVGILYYFYVIKTNNFNQPEFNIDKPTSVTVEEKIPSNTNVIKIRDNVYLHAEKGEDIDDIIYYLKEKRTPKNNDENEEDIDKNYENLINELNNVMEENNKSSEPEDTKDEL